MILDFSRCRLPPFAHQREDVAWLMKQPFALIASEMRTGKSKIVIDAAQFLFEAGVIDKVIIISPAPVRDVWYDPQLGEIVKHAWRGMHHKIFEFHAKLRGWNFGDGMPKWLEWWVTNFEFLRAKNRLTQLLPACGPKTLLVGDESSFLKNNTAQQTKAFLQLRRACGRVVLLNGTPIFHSPLDLFSQGNILHHSILDCKFITLFKARYAIQTPVRGFGGKALLNPYGKPIQEITGWTNLDDLERRFAPYTVRRMQADCLDLPPKLDPVTLTATLEPATWKAYKDMRDELVVWLTQSTVATSATAAIKALRLSQITGGFLGGVEDAGIEAVGIEAVDTELLERIDLPGSFLDGLVLQPDGAKALQQQAKYFNGVINERIGLRGDQEGLPIDGQEPSTDHQSVARDPGGTEGSQQTDTCRLGASVASIGEDICALGLDNNGNVLDGDAGLDFIDGSETIMNTTGGNAASVVGSSIKLGRDEHGILSLPAWPRTLPPVPVHEIGREKLDVLLWFIAQRLEADPNLHLVAWGRFRVEVFRAEREVKKRFPQFTTAVILGGQKKADRLAALALLKPETSPEGPVFVCGIEGTGSFGLDMTAAHTCVTMSSGYSPGRSAQTLDRVYGPGQTQPIAYFDIVAVGPRGQKTIDHDILVARRAGEDVARRTAAAWVKALKEE